MLSTIRKNSKFKGERVVLEASLWDWCGDLPLVEAKKCLPDSTGFAVLARNATKTT